MSQVLELPVLCELGACDAGGGPYGCGQELPVQAAAELRRAGRLLAEPGGAGHRCSLTR